MTNEPAPVPFIARFAARIDPATCQTLRYDEQRQLSQTIVLGKWVDAVLARGQLSGDTRITKIQHETTDDA